MNEEGNDINDHCFTTSLSVEGAPLEEAANGWETWEWERAASWTFSWAEPHRRPTKTFAGISVLFSFKMFVSERKRSAENKIRRCVVSPLPRSLFIADHQIYHSFSFWWQSKQIYHLCHQNPICPNTLSLEGFTESVERFQFTEWRSIGYILGFSRSPNCLGDFSKSTSLELILPSWFNI